MIGTILGILGIIITFGFGGYSIWVYKKSKRVVSLEFRNKECYSLFREDVNRLNIELIYNKTTLNNTLILLKGKLVNNGQVDIDKNRIYTPLKIKSPENYKWLEATVTSSPKDAQTNIGLINRQEIELTWDLLKQNESIEIEALVEITGEIEKEEEKGTDFYNSITFDYRITDLNSVQKDKQISNSLRARSRFDRLSKVMAIITILIGSIFLSFEFFPSLNFMEKQIVSYDIKSENNEVSSFITANSDGKVILLFDGEEDKKEITVGKFNDTYQITRIEKTTTDPKSNLYNRLMGGVYLLMGGLILMLRLIKNRTKKAANNV